MKVSEFDYNLPAELIAQHPLPHRDESRLMVLNREAEDIEHTIFRDLPDFLMEGDVLVLNRTKVIPARLRGFKEGTGGRVEVLLLKMREDSTWECLVRPARRIRTGTRIKFGQGELSGEIIGLAGSGSRIIQFDHDRALKETLDRIGEIPIPPYIKGHHRNTRIDSQSPLGRRYQTVYAREEGAVASPTAGLHFTNKLLKRIENRGVKVAFLVLHLGWGSFQSLKEEDVEKHRMPSEFYQIDEETVKLIKCGQKRRIIAVGTSTVRALESLASSADVTAHSGWTDLFICPGYKFRAVDGLITNFHLPRSSNLILVSAFAGREFLLRAYAEAVKEGYRFYSFGDAMLIL